MVGGSGKEEPFQQLSGRDFLALFQGHEFGDFVHRFDDALAFWEVGTGLMVVAKNDGFPYNNFSAGGRIAFCDEVKQSGLARPVAADNADAFAALEVVG